MGRNILMAQSGGPTSAINATISGLIEQAIKEPSIDKIYGAKHGIKGVLNEDFIDLGEAFGNPTDIMRLYHTPSAALGSCRYKLALPEKDDSDYASILRIFDKYDIGFFAYVGGNDSMDTVDKLGKYLKAKNRDDIIVIGVPKTIDNDLVSTDHCPGYGSAAKYIGTTFTELERDCRVYDTKSVTIVEVMGRNAGWLTAASALSRIHGGMGPNLIYLCETVFDSEKFLEDIKEAFTKTNGVLVAISEGIKGKSGKYVSEEDSENAFVDAFGHKHIAGSARVLEKLVMNELGYKVRPIELSLIQRSAAHLASATDLRESKNLGIRAVKHLVEGKGNIMVSLERISDSPYEIKLGYAPVDSIANREKKVPLEWISESKNDVTQELMDYMLPLIQGEVPSFFENGIPKHKILF
ncbi:6-phosphofructokinase [Anaeropeptidivorans aminofermentans]|jgi:6-phosphofructokinase 1|uniref:6-phosphofructokinase n=1 Tax=Anaeropeptidivorans aminofermentans TaxID=2934315 RepID=UPI002024510D|nr:6-phosphofructokinase [Anaeropeptidivorans aminofermentans]MBE6011255.1 6-phosphofructokinase [Lachnospiraceae bacterium]